MAEEPDEVECIARFLAVESGSDPDTVVHLEEPWRIMTPLGIAKVYHTSALLWQCYTSTARHIIRNKDGLFPSEAEKDSA